MNIKNFLYEFEAKHVLKKEDGSNETLLKKFAILKPNRRLREDGELFYAAETSRFAKAGVLPKAAWNTILSNGGGSISEKEREIYGGLLIKFRDASFELQSILIKAETERTQNEKKRADEIIVELEEIRKEIQSFESSQIAIFENTAEAKARNRTILWWILNLSQEYQEGSYGPMFNGETFQDKLDQYDFLEETESEDDFKFSVVRRLTYLVTLWFLGKAESFEAFKEFDEGFLQEKEEVVLEDRQSEVIEETIVNVEEVKSPEASEKQANETKPLSKEEKTSEKVDN
jgi:hypothetical protein